MRVRNTYRQHSDGIPGPELHPPPFCASCESSNRNHPACSPPANLSRGIAGRPLASRQSPSISPSVSPRTLPGSSCRGVDLYGDSFLQGLDLPNGLVFVQLAVSPPRFRVIWGQPALLTRSARIRVATLLASPDFSARQYLETPIDSPTAVARFTRSSIVPALGPTFLSNFGKILDTSPQ